MDTTQKMKRIPLTESEENELQLLRLLQADRTRWLSMSEFNRIQELATRAANAAGHYSDSAPDEPKPERWAVVRNVCIFPSEDQADECIENSYNPDAYTVFKLAD